MDSSRAGEIYGAIANLYSKYAHALDHGDSHAFSECFAEDASFWPNRGPIQADKGCFRGKEAIRAFVQTTQAARPRHIVLNLVIDEASLGRARCRALFALFDIEHGSVTALGQYSDDAVVAEDGAWRFSDKQVRFIWQSDVYRERAEKVIPTSQID